MSKMFSTNTHFERDPATREAETYLRANRRYKTSSGILITNLSRLSRTLPGVLLDFSTSGMRIETPLVRVEAGSHAVLGEDLYFADLTPERPGAVNFAELVEI